MQHTVHRKEARNKFIARTEKNVKERFLKKHNHHEDWEKEFPAIHVIEQRFNQWWARQVAQGFHNKFERTQTDRGITFEDVLSQFGFRGVYKFRAPIQLEDPCIDDMGREIEVESVAPVPEDVE